MTPSPAAEHAPRLRGALVQTLERDLDPSGGNLLMLSGGVDSSAIGALAAGVLGREVSTLTVLSPDQEARDHDLRYIDALDRAVGFERRTEVVIDAERRIALLDEPGVPFHVPQPLLGLLPALVREQPVSVVVGGEFADQTVGSTQLLHDWARHTTLGDLWRARGSLPTGPRDAGRWVVHRLRRTLRRARVPFSDELPEFVRAELRAEYREWLARRRAATARDDGPMPYLANYLDRTGFIGMQWEVTSALGIRRSLPFVSRELLELAFECHPAELVGTGTKGLLRRALRDDVPAPNLDRPDKGLPARVGDQGPRRWHEEIPDQLQPLFEPGWPSQEVPYWTFFRARTVLAFLSGFNQARAIAQPHPTEHGLSTQR